MNPRPVRRPSPLPFPPGTVLLGKYRVERMLGEGGMGCVVVATHLALEQRVALKFMHANHATASPESVARFLREARTAARIQSEHVARVSDVGVLENGAPYLVMECLEGQDLDALLAERTSVPVPLAIEYALQACEGLAEAHVAGIVHRDLKPANLFLARRTDGSVRVKLLDFGISKLVPGPGTNRDVALTSTQTLMGSPLYMAPEQLRSSKNVDRRADIWSLGVILYEMLAGQSPFVADTLPEVCARVMTEPPPPLTEIAPGVPPALAAVIMQCLEKDPQRRFADAGALAHALVPFGTPDAQATAERIGRVTRASPLSSPELPPDPSGSGSILLSPDASGPVQIIRGPAPVIGAETNALFGTETSARLLRRRTSTLPLLIGGGAFVLGVIIVVAVTASGPEAPSAAGAPSSTSASVTPSTPATATTTAPPSPTPTTSLAPTSAWSNGFTGAPTSGGQPRAPAKPKPGGPAGAAGQPGTAGAAAATAPRPASTVGFGGRD